jgi:NADPH-dependent F420 reductase
MESALIYVNAISYPIVMEAGGSHGSFAPQYKLMVKKTIAIIGATGKMGSAIAKGLAKGPYRLLLFARDGQKANALAEEIRRSHPSSEIDCIGCPKDACWEADIIIPAVPYVAEKETARQIEQVATQKIVISISNPLNPSFNGLLTSTDTSAAEELQQLLPYSKVVKAFNTVFAADFSQAVIGGKKPDVFLAGNDEEGLNTVSELVAMTGFNPVVAGELSLSRTLENMTLLLIRLNAKYHYNSVAGWKILHN